MHRISVKQGLGAMRTSAEADDEADDVTETGEAPDDGPPGLSERHSELALNILEEYGLVQRYTDEKCLHKLERLRKHVVARERAEERARQKERAAMSEKPSFSLATGDTYGDPKPPMEVSIFDPSLEGTMQSSRHRRTSSVDRSSAKNAQAPLGVKEFKFALEAGLPSPQPSPTRNPAPMVPGFGTHIVQESPRSPSGQAPLIPSFSQKRFKSSRPGSPKPVLLQPSQGSNPAG